MKDKIKEVILSVNPGIDVEDPDLNIAEDMDSMDIIALIAELEDAFDIEITMEEKSEENFSSIDALAEMIERLQ
ncbi:acyl carrier protein [Eubacterium sp.]